MRTMRWMAGLGLMFSLTACDCGAQVQEVLPALADVSDDLPFGSVAVGDTKSLTVTLTALTAAELKLAVAIDDPGTPFRIEGTVPEVIDPKGSVDVKVTYAPVARETSVATLVVTTDDPDAARGNHRITLSGTGADPAIAVGPGSLSLTAIACPPGATGATCRDTKKVTIESTGDVRLSIATVELRAVPGGALPTGLVLARPVAATKLEPGGKLAVDVVWAPSASEVKTAYDGAARLVVTSNDPLRPSVEVPVSVHADPNVAPTAAIRVVSVSKRVFTRTAGGAIQRSTVSVPSSEYLCTDAGTGCVVGELQLRPGMKVRLSSDGSGDPEGDTVVPVWSLSVKPGESRAAPAPAKAVETDVDVDAVGRYTVSLSVADGLSQTATAALVLNAVPRDDLAVQLAWQDAAGMDLDLHLLLDEGPGVTTPARPFCTQDCFFYNPAPSWMGTGTEDDPFLLRDDQGSSGMLESLSLQTAPVGSRYRVGVHAYSLGSYAALPTVTLRLRAGEVVQTLTPSTSLADGDFWVVGSVFFPAVGSPTITPVNTLLKPTDSPSPNASEYSAFTGAVGACE